MDKFPVMLWMLLWPFMDDLSTVLMKRAGLNPSGLTPEYGGMMLAIWIIGTIILFPW